MRGLRRRVARECALNTRRRRARRFCRGRRSPVARPNGGGDPILVLPQARATPPRAARRPRRPREPPRRAVFARGPRAARRGVGGRARALRKTSRAWGSSGGVRRDRRRGRRERWRRSSAFLRRRGRPARWRRAASPPAASSWRVGPGGRRAERRLQVPLEGPFIQVAVAAPMGRWSCVCSSTSGSKPLSKYRASNSSSRFAS